MNKNNILGISLVEILVALSITTISIMGLTTLQMQNLRDSFDTHQNSHAIFIVDDIINRIRANKGNQNEYITMNFEGTSDFKNCDDLESMTNTFCSSHHNGIKRIPAHICNKEELARYDIYSAMCDRFDDKNNNVQGNQHSLINPEIKIENINNGELRITLQWLRRTLGRENDNSKNANYKINIIP